MEAARASVEDLREYAKLDRRFDAEKKSPVLWIVLAVNIALLAAIGSFIYKKKVRGVKAPNRAG